MRPLLTILRLWRPQTGWLVLGFLISLASAVAAVALFMMSGATVASASVAGGLLSYGVLRGLGVGRVVLRYFERLVTHEATFRALAALRVWFFRALAAGTAGGLGFRRSGDVLSRIVNDVEALDGLYLRILVPLGIGAVMVPAIVVLIGMQSWGLAALVGALFILSALVLPWAAAQGTIAAGGRLTRAMSGLRIACLDALTGLREVRAFGAEGRMLAMIQARQGSLLSAQDSMNRRSAWAGAGAFLCGQAAILLVLLSAGNNPMVSVVSAFVVIAAFETVAGLPRAGALAGHAATAAVRVLEVAAAAPPATHHAPVTIEPHGPARLSFEGVRFAWQPDRPVVFSGLTLDIPAGSRVAILGPSGSGKSTLAALALKVALPQSGRVLLGGVDMARLTDAQVRSRIGWLGQATHLFDDTIRGNLLLARPDADDTALWQGLDAARIGDVVRALPDQMDTWVGEAGGKFSGGQGRRLALARALLSPAPVLILDEPCAGLDGETEREFFSVLNDTAEGRTIILIAHRLTGTERLDRIWRLSGGHAVAATS
jgi:ATP-binding cassette subfamily C protein CydC